MNNELFFLNSQKKKTNHILHLILSVISGGLWLPVWIIVAVDNASINREIDKKIKKLFQ